MQPETVFSRPYTLQDTGNPDEVPTRFFVIGGWVWGMTPDGHILDLEGAAAPADKADEIRDRINGFLAARL
jgi:hypothetical protein